jgi:hypothetical protein
MNKVIAILVAGLFATAAFAQAPAPTSQAEPAKAAASKPVRASIRPEPDIAGTTTNDAQAADATGKAEKHKKAKGHKKTAKSESAAEAKTEPGAKTK